MRLYPMLGATSSETLTITSVTSKALLQADVSMLPCWGVLNDIKSCFKESILNS